MRDMVSLKAQGVCSLTRAGNVRAARGMRNLAAGGLVVRSVRYSVIRGTLSRNLVRLFGSKKRSKTRYKRFFGPAQATALAPAQKRVYGPPGEFPSEVNHRVFSESSAILVSHANQVRAS